MSELLKSDPIRNNRELREFSDRKGALEKRIQTAAEKLFSNPSASEQDRADFQELDTQKAELLAQIKDPNNPMQSHETRMEILRETEEVVQQMEAIARIYKF